MLWLAALAILAFTLYCFLCRHAYNKGYREGYNLGTKMGFESGELEFQEKLYLLKQERRANRRAAVQGAKHLRVVK